MRGRVIRSVATTPLMTTEPDMSVIDLHPDDLLDRDADGTLTPAERTHLEAHLRRCAACRFEQRARADFAACRTDDEGDAPASWGVAPPPPLVRPA